MLYTGTQIVGTVYKITTKCMKPETQLSQTRAFDFDMHAYRRYLIKFSEVADG